MEKFLIVLVIIGLISLIISVAITPWASIVLVIDFAVMMMYSSYSADNETQNDNFKNQTLR